MTLDEEKHILQLIKEDPGQFGIIFDSFYNQIFSYIFKRIADYDISRDIAAETFLKTFLLGIFIKYKLGIYFKIFNSLEDLMGNFDKIPYLKWISPLILVGLPVIGIVINSLAITHFYWDKAMKELLITIKYRLANIILLLISMGIVAVFVLYAIVENIHHHA